MGPRIRSEDLETTGKPSLKLYLQCVVIGPCNVADNVRICKTRVGRLHNRGLNQAPSERPYVRRGQAVLSSKGLFQSQVPLQRVRQLQVGIEGSDRSSWRTE